ncbi:MAG: excinuclease ABC subunit UvrC [Chloroflexota bacterium]|nr:MAG: excinuclease ABC subunit UvrC [Chloroflexota bacterium]
MSAIKPSIQQTLDTLPTKPGVYLMQNDDGTIIYVGKAVNLRNRVRSYFHGNVFDAKVVALTTYVEKIEFIVTDTELEALVLENNLIKKYRPKYNIRLKDAKTYPYIKITWQDNFPKVYMTRRMDNDGARYFGPFTAVWAVHETLDTLRKIFPYLTCDRDITGKDKRACLYYDIGLCLAPCIGAASRDEYRAMIDRLSQFLQGHSEEVTQNIHDKLSSAAENLEFERAAVYRDQLQAISRITEHQKVVSPQMVDQDVIAFAKDDGNACVQVFFIRAGKLLGREYFVLEGTTHANTDDVLSSFVQQFYDQAAYIPPEILLPEMIDEAKIIESWLKQNKGAATTIRVPRNGNDASGRDLLNMAEENARITLETIKQQWLADKTKHLQAVEELQQALEMENPPLRMECYDISNIQGTNSVGAMVVFENGAAKKSDYRKFKIKSVIGANDFASLQEMLRRRFKRYQDAKKAEQASDEWRVTGDGAGELAQEGVTQDEKRETRSENEQVSVTDGQSFGSGEKSKIENRKSKIPLSKGFRTAERKNDESWARMPDLVIIDGGKGQLSAAEEVFREMGIEGVKLISLAKREEEVFTPNRADSLRLPMHSPALHLLQRIRDEAHRFGITYHRSLRAKKGLHSQLDAIPGIGPRRRRALLQKFDSLDAIRDASVEELMQVEGMSKSAAQKLKESL